MQVPTGWATVTFQKVLNSYPGEALVSVGGKPVVSSVKLGHGRILFVGGYLCQDFTSPPPEGNAVFVRAMLERCGVKPGVHTDRPHVHAVVQSNESERYLFLLNLEHRARRVTCTFPSRPPASLEDVYTGQSVELGGGCAVVDVDCKRARIFRVGH